MPRKHPKQTLTLPQLRQNIQEGAGALLSGGIEAGVDISRYSQLGANLLLEDKQNRAIEAAKINRIHSNPPFFSDDFNAYRAYLKATYPKLSTTGEVAAGGLSAAGVKTAKYLLPYMKAGNRLQRNPLSALWNLKQRNSWGAGDVATGAAFGLAAENGSEKVIQDLNNLNF